MKGVIVSGNIDMDHLMFIDGLFKDSILPGRLNNLSVSFQPNKHETSFGGCAANISYTLRLLGIKPYLFSVLGNDYKSFFKWFDSNKISTKYIDVDETKMSAAAYIMNDRNKNQITFFSSGASMNPDIGMDLKELSNDDADIMIIAPNTPERMLALSRDAFRSGFIYSYLSGDTMKRACENATVAASFSLESLGTQTHHFSMLEFKERLDEYFPKK